MLFDCLFESLRLFNSEICERKTETQNNKVLNFTEREMQYGIRVNCHAKRIGRISTWREMWWLKEKWKDIFCGCDQYISPKGCSVGVNWHMLSRKCNNKYTQVSNILSVTLEINAEDGPSNCSRKVTKITHWWIVCRWHKHIYIKCSRSVFMYSVSGKINFHFSIEIIWIESPSISIIDLIDQKTIEATVLSALKNPEKFYG